MTSIRVLSNKWSLHGITPEQLASLSVLDVCRTLVASNQPKSNRWRTRKGTGEEFALSGGLSECLKHVVDFFHVRGGA